MSSALLAPDPPLAFAENSPTIRRVVFAVGGLYTEGSGVARIVSDLANGLVRRGAPVDVYTAACPGRGASDRMLDPPNRLRTAPGRWMGRLAWSPALRRMLNQGVRNADIVHNHSLWMLPTSYATRAAVRHGIPVVFTIHGFLERWSLARSRWKKRLAGVAFQNRDLRRAACLHVNSERELAGVRRYGLRNPVAVIPNGIDPDDFNDLPPRSEFERLVPAVRGRRVCLFLSRLHEKKGLEHLIVAWHRLTGELRDWHLVIAGPDDGFGPRLRAAIDSLGLAGRVSVPGPLFGRDKLAAYAAADVFALPSFSEGFSIAVLEALACGLPVLLTPGCNFPEVADFDAGVEVAPDVAGTEEGLRRLLCAPDSLRKQIGRNARRLVAANYTWDRVAEQMLGLYQWLAGSAARPDFVCT